MTPWIAAKPSAERLALEERVRSIAPASAAAWRALVSHPLIDECVRVELASACPREWNALVPTGEDNVRYCNACQRKVYFCGLLSEIFARAISNECVAFDIGLSPETARTAYETAANTTASGSELRMGEIAARSDLGGRDPG